MELPDNPVRLPPLVRETGCTVDVRVDARGSAVAAPVVVGGECPWLDRIPVTGAGVLPGRAVRVGETWPLRSGASVLGARSLGATREGAAQLTRLEGATAELVWHGTEVLEPLTASRSTRRSRRAARRRSRSATASRAVGG